jgi:hypothetical protein
VLGYLLGAMYLAQILLTVYLVEPLHRERILWVIYAAFLPVIAPVNAFILRRRASRLTSDPRDGPV